MSGDQISLKDLRERCTEEAPISETMTTIYKTSLLAFVEAVDALNEVHEYQCGCDRPGNPAACVAQPRDVFVALARFKDYEGEA